MCKFYKDLQIIGDKIGEQWQTLQHNGRILLKRLNSTMGCNAKRQKRKSTYFVVCKHFYVVESRNRHQNLVDFILPWPWAWFWLWHTIALWSAFWRWFRISILLLFNGVPFAASEFFCIFEIVLACRSVQFLNPAMNCDAKRRERRSMDYLRTCWCRWRQEGYQNLVAFLLPWSWA